MSIMLARKPTPLPAWHLTDQAAMLTALDELSDLGWRGSVMRDPSADTWRLELNADTPTRQAIASVGEWLVLDGDLRAMSDADCTANYEAAP